MLRVDVTKQLGEFALEASFASEGRVTGLFGVSGAGKTSLINMIAGLLRPDRGVIALDDEVTNLGGWELLDAYGISANGTIVGKGELSHAIHGFMLVPQAGR